MADPDFDLARHVHRHGEALRQLASELVHDPGAADDVVQETWLGAMLHPPRHQQAMGGWLATLLRNFAHGLGRRERRRARREQLAAAERSRTVDDAATAAMRSDAARTLITAVEELGAPYRGAIWHRYFEGMAPRAIAAANRVPVTTVKSWLKRGLGMLRERLGERGDDDWRAGFVAAFGLGKQGTATVAAGVVAGGMLMATWTKVAAVGAAVVLAIASMMWWPDVAPATPGAAANDAPPPAASAAGSEAPPDVQVPGGELQRTAVATPPPAVPKLATIRGRCVDEHGAAIAGCSAVLGGWFARSQGADDWLLEHGDQRIEQKTSTAADGRFEFSFAPPPPYSFRLDLEGDAWATVGSVWNDVEAGAVIDLGDVTMQPGARVSGRLVDTMGLPVATGQIKAERPPRGTSGTLAARSSAWARSGDDGAFAFDVVLPFGSYSLQLGDDYTVQSPVPLVVDAAAGAAAIQVVASRPDVPTITGTVVDAADRPVPFASVTWGQGANPCLGGGYSLRNGSFTLRCTAGTAGDTTKPVRIGASQYGHEATQLERDVPWGARDVRVRIMRGTELTVLACDAAGQPLQGCTVRVLPPGDWQMRGGGKVRTGINGVAAFDRLVRGDYVVVAQFGASRGLHPRIERVTLEGSPVQLELRFGSQPSRRLRVQRSDGAPVAGTRVQVCELFGRSFDGHCQVLAQDKWFEGSTAPRILVIAEEVTDAEGISVLRGPGGRELGLRVLGPGHVPVEQANLRLDVAGELVVTVAVGARVHGRIEPPEAIDELRRLAGKTRPGFPAADRRPRLLLRRAGKDVPDIEAGPAEQERFMVEADGTFDVGGLPAGQWQVVLRYFATGASVSMTRDVGLTTCDLRDGESTLVHANLTHLVPGTFRAVVLRNGAPWARGSFVVESAHGIGADGNEVREWLQVATDADGRFEFTGRPGRYWLREPADQSSIAMPTIELVRGAVLPVTFAFAAGEVAIRLLLADGTPAAGVEVVGTDGPLGVTSAEGRATIVRSPGKLSLRVLPKRLQSESARNELRVVGGFRADPFAAYWVRLGEVTFVAGRTTPVELRLPPEWDK